MTLEMNRRSFVGKSAVLGAGLTMAGPLTAFAQRGGRDSARGYGPLVLKQAQNDRSATLFLPEEFDFVVLDRQGTPMDDGNPTPGIFDGMGAFPGKGRTTILIRNHENRELPGEIPVVVPTDKAYDPSTIAGDTKVVVERGRREDRSKRRSDRFEAPRLNESFAILGGISTACAGGVTPFGSWVTCEEVVKRTGERHGYSFEIDAQADRPVEAVPILAAGRFAHEAVAFLDGILYQTEDRNSSDGGAAFYRYLLKADRDDFEGEDDDRSDGDRERQRELEREHERRSRDAEGQALGDPDALDSDEEARSRAREEERDEADRDRDGRRRRGKNTGRLARTNGVLQALKVRGERNADMDSGRKAGDTFRVEWVTIDDPDHDDDTDQRRDRIPGMTPTRFQAQDKGAAIFDREEGMWIGDGKVYFDCTSGGDENLGQVWEYDPDRERLTLIFESEDVKELENPDNLVVVPATGDLFLQEDSDGDQFVRGLTTDGRIYDFARSGNNDTEFCGGVFDPQDDFVFYLNQQGERGGSEPDGSTDGQAITYAIFGPFEDRDGRRRRQNNDRGDDRDGRRRDGDGRKDGEDRDRDDGEDRERRGRGDEEETPVSERP